MKLKKSDLNRDSMIFYVSSYNGGFDAILLDYQGIGMQHIVNELCTTSPYLSDLYFKEEDIPNEPGFYKWVGIVPYDDDFDEYTEYEEFLQANDDYFQGTCQKLSDEELIKFGKTGKI